MDYGLKPEKELKFLRISSSSSNKKQKNLESPKQDSPLREALPVNISGTYSKIGELYDEVQSIFASLDSKIDLARKYQHNLCQIKIKSNIKHQKSKNSKQKAENRKQKTEKQKNKIRYHQNTLRESYLIYPPKNNNSFKKEQIFKIDAAIEKESREFLSAYKIHLLKITYELQDCKTKLDDNEAKIQRDSQIHMLSEMLEKCKREKLELAQSAIEQKKEILQLKSIIQSMENEKMHLEKKYKKILTENKAFQITLKKIEASFAIQQTEANSIVSGKETRKLESKFQDVDYNVQSEQFIEFVKKFDKEVALDQCLHYMKANFLKHEEIINTIKQQLSQEKKVSQRLRAQQTESTSSKSDLEQLFQDCVEETRKRIQQRKAYHRTSLSRESEPPPRISNFSTMNKVQILEQFMLNEKLLRALFEVVFNPSHRLPAIHTAERSSLSKIKIENPANNSGIIQGKIPVKFDVVDSYCRYQRNISTQINSRKTSLGGKNPRLERSIAVTRLSQYHY